MLMWLPAKCPWASCCTFLLVYAPLSVLSCEP